MILYCRKLIQKKRSRIGSSDGGQEEEVRSKRRLATRRRRHHAQVQGEDRFPAPPTLPPWADQEVILVVVSNPGGRTASPPLPLFHPGRSGGNTSLRFHVQGEDRFPAPPTLSPWADQEVILVFVSSPGGRTASPPRPLFHPGQIRR